MDTKTPVVVLQSAHHGGLAVVRTMGRLGVPVSVVDADPCTPAFFSKYCRGKHIWDLDQTPPEQSVEYLDGIGRQLGRPAVLIPTTDKAALFIAANAAHLRTRFLFTNVEPDLALSLYSKQKMAALAARFGIPTPRTYFPTSKRDLVQFAGGATFPIMLKAVEARYATSDAARTKIIVHRPEDLIASYTAMENPERPNVMCQEYIPGGEEANWMFNGYFDENSDCRFGLTGKKIRQNRPYAGVTSLGVCAVNPTVEDTTRGLMKRIGYRGILDIGYRYDARDGQYKVFDINPRVGCTFRLFVSDSGMDAVRALYLDLTGQHIDAGRPLPGRKWMVEDMDMAASWRYWQDGNLTAGQWLRSFRGVRESAYFARDDFGPVSRMLRNDLRALFQSSQKNAATLPRSAPTLPLQPVS